MSRKEKEYPKRIYFVTKEVYADFVEEERVRTGKTSFRDFGEYAYEKQEEKIVGKITGELYETHTNGKTISLPLEQIEEMVRKEQIKIITT